MTQPLTDAIARELAEYEEHIQEYRRGEIGDVKMQKIRLQFGTYAQRQDGVQMQRIKIPGGVLSADQMVCLADAADRFGSSFVHLTTREDVQIYYLKLEEAPNLLRFLAAADITTREACGNTVRNITACYRAGTSPTEVFDVAPYAHALFRYLVRNDHNQVMGRKFKITFEGCAEDHIATAIKDPGHLKRWLLETGRTWIVFKNTDLIDALPWPDGVDIFMQVVEAYRQHRITVPVDYAPCPKPHTKGRVCELCSNDGQVITRSKSDLLELDEMKEACVWLINQITEHDKTWNPFQ